MSDVTVRNGNDQSTGITGSRNPVDQVFRNLEKEFGRLLGRGWPTPRGRWSDNPMTRSGDVDVIDKDDSYEVRMDMPGVNSDDVGVSVRNNTLKIRAEREDSFEEEDGEYVRYANKKQSHSFSFNLGQDQVNVENIEASLDNGVLRVDLPKKDSAEVHREIDVQ